MEPSPEETKEPAPVILLARSRARIWTQIFMGVAVASLSQLHSPCPVLVKALEAAPASWSHQHHVGLWFAQEWPLPPWNPNRLTPTLRSFLQGKKITYFNLHVGLHECMYMYGWCLKRAERVSDPLKLGLKTIVGPMCWKTEHGSYARTSSTFNLWFISTGPTQTNFQINIL